MKKKALKAEIRRLQNDLNRTRAAWVEGKTPTDHDRVLVAEYRTHVPEWMETIRRTDTPLLTWGVDFPKRMTFGDYDESPDAVKIDEIPDTSVLWGAGKREEEWGEQEAVQGAGAEDEPADRGVSNPADEAAGQAGPENPGPQS